MDNMDELYNKQMAAEKARNDTAGQIAYAKELLGTDMTESEQVIALERKFFLGRKTALEIFAFAAS